MKIAVASTDGVDISQHFGRSSCFIIFEVGQNGIMRLETRENNGVHHHEHDPGECQSRGEHSGHDHSVFASILKDCEAVICHGMGMRAAQALAAGGIIPYAIADECTPEEAVTMLAEGRLQAGQGFCSCSH